MRTIVGYTETGATIWSDNIPARAVIASRGGLTLGQALTASNIKPIADVTPRTVPGLRGESVLARRKRHDGR